MQNQTNAKVEYIDTYYQWMTGRKPRGYGLWVFQFNHRGNHESQRIEIYEVYSKAKKAAIKAAQMRGCDMVRVMP